MAIESAVELEQGQTLLALTREKDARSYGYVIRDRFGTVVVCTQKLPLAAAYINSMKGGALYDKIAVASLYEAAALGRLVHRRWTVTRVPLEGAVKAFEAERGAAAKSVVLGAPHRIRIG